MEREKFTRGCEKMENIRSNTFVNLEMRLSVKWGGAQFMPTAFTLLVLFIMLRHSSKVSPDGAF